MVGRQLQAHFEHLLLVQNLLLQELWLARRTIDPQRERQVRACLDAVERDIQHVWEITYHESRRVVEQRPILGRGWESREHYERHYERLSTEEAEQQRRRAPPPIIQTPPEPAPMAFGGDGECGGSAVVDAGTVETLVDLARQDKEADFRELAACVGVPAREIDGLWEGTRRRLKKEPTKSREPERMYFSRPQDPNEYAPPPLAPAPGVPLTRVPWPSPPPCWPWEYPAR